MVYKKYYITVFNFFNEISSPECNLHKGKFSIVGNNLEGMLCTLCDIKICICINMEYYKIMYFSDVCMSV